MKKTWVDTVRDEMELKKMTQDDIAESLNKTQGAIGHWLNNRRSPNFNEVVAMLSAVGFDKLILNSDGTLENFDNNVKQTTINHNYTYPLLSNIQAGTFTDVCDLHGIEGYEMIGSDIKTKGPAFFLRITGDSMLPKFNENDLVLIDTGRIPHPGDYVAAVNGDGQATFKRYKELGELAPCGNPHFELVPLNDVFPTISSINRNIRIIGVAVEHRSYL